MKVLFRKKYLGWPTGRSGVEGVAAVEFALVIVVLLLIVAGIIGLGRIFWYLDALTKSTRDGARLLSSWPAATIGSVGLNEAKLRVMNSANAAGITPQLDSTNVDVKCMYEPSPSEVACMPGVAPPQTVRVSITGFSVGLGDWFPFIGANGVINYGRIALSPHTTMRYMN